MAPGGAAGVAKKNSASGVVKKSKPAKNAPLRSQPPRTTATSRCSREVVLLYARTLLAAVFVLFIVHIHPRDSAPVPQRVDVANPTKHDVALCWLPFGSSEEQLLRDAPQGCHRVLAGDGTGDTDRDAFWLNTYVGHRLLILPWPEQNGNAAAVSSAYHFIYIKPDMGTYTVEDFAAEGNLNIKRLLNILQSPVDTWQALLRFRHYFSLFLVSSCILYLQFGSSGSKTTSVRNGKAASKSMTKPNMNMMVHRHSLKAFAVSTMLLDHASRLISDENSLGRFAGTIPADLVGSAQIFWFLAGYNSSSLGATRSSGPRSDSTKLLAAFFLLELFCALPRGITYETLFTIFVARSLLKLEAFQCARNEKDADGGGGEARDQSGGSRFTHLPLYVHAVLCSLLIALHPYLNADGLRLVQTRGILYAVAGRLLGNAAAGESESGGRARCVGLFWLFSAWTWQFKFASEFHLHNLETGSAKYAVAWICAAGAIFQFFVLAVPAEETLWLPSRASTFVSRYSLEIYCLHLAILWCLYGT